MLCPCRVLSCRGGAKSIPRPPAPPGPAYPEGRVQLFPDRLQRGLRCSNHHTTTTSSRGAGTQHEQGQLQAEGPVATEHSGSGSAWGS